MTDTRLEVWDRPGTAGFASRIETLDSIVDSSRLQPVNGIGEGKVSVPDTFTEVDKVLTVDPVTPANSVRSLIRVYLDGDVSGVSTPYREWLPDAAIPPSEAESGRYEITGLGIESIVRDAVVEPWDWNGERDFASSWPDWIYGGRDLISPLNTVFRPHIFHVWVVPTGGAISGTLDISLSFDGAAFEDATVAWNASALTVEAALEAFTFSPDVEVSGFGTEANPWEISVLSPGGLYVSAQSTGALVNAVARGSLKQFGLLLPVGWELSKLDNTSIPHGGVTEFRASLGVSPDPALPAGCPAWIMFNGTEPMTPGVQTVPLKVIPGGIYQLTNDMILRAGTGGALVRVVVRDLDENILFDINGNPAFEEINLAANTDTNITGIPDIIIPEGVSQIIIRVGHIGAGDPPPIWIACPSFIEGFEANTVGYIVRKFYEDWTVDHIADTFPLDYWLHGDGGHYLDLDFTDSLDSAGNAWPRDEKITVRAGSRFDKVLGLIVGLGYEWRVVPAPVDGYWLLQIFAAPTLGTVLPGPSPTIRGGRDLIKRAIRRWLPKTGVMVQGADQFFSHAASAGAQATLGISTDYQPRPDYEPEATIVAAPVAVDNAIRRTRSLVVTVADVQEPLFPIPGRDYVPGDTIRVIDPPEIVDDPERVWSILYTRTEQGIVWEIQLGNESFASTGGGGGGASGGGAGGGVDPAVAEPLRWLLDKEELNRQRPPAPPDRPPEPGCCPSCPAIVNGVAPGGVVGTTTTLDWIIDNDPDGIVAETVSGNLKLLQPGLYSVHLLLIWRFNTTAAGWATWLTEAFCSNNDAGNSSFIITSGRSSATVMELLATHFFWAHVADGGESIGAYFLLEDQQSAGLINTATGVVSLARMTVIRHGEGCARTGGGGMILVSLPYFQTPHLIRRAVDSILSQHVKLKLVVINDGGTEGVWEPLEDIEDSRLVRFDLPKNRGRYYCDAVTLAANPYEHYTIHDSDDWSETGRYLKLLAELGGMDVAVDGWTRHGQNDSVQRFKSRPELVGHRTGRSLWHIAHHKGLWTTEALRGIGMPAQFRVGWDTYLMHIAALTLKVAWVDYYGYHQQRRKNSLITSPLTGVQSRHRASAIVELDRIWKEVQAEPDRAVTSELEVEVQADADRLLMLL